MPDILSQGGGRESGPWPRRLAAVAVLVLVAVLIVHYLPQSRHRTARPTRAAVTVTPPPAVSSAFSGDAGVVAEPDGITGQIMSWPGGLRLPATGERPVWFWPATGQVMIAASATQIAWSSSCVARCRVQVLNLANGRQASVELPAASSVANAAFSPDGSSLVIQVSFSDNTANGARAVQLERVSLASGHLAAVPHTWVSSDALIGFGWPASSNSLVAEFSFTTKTQLASWRPGASRLAIVVLRPQRSPASLVIGQHAA